MISGISPEQMRAVQQLTSSIEAEIKVDRKGGRMEVIFKTSNPQAQTLIPAMVEQLASNLAVQLNVYFAMKGEWEDIS